MPGCHKQFPLSHRQHKKNVIMGRDDTPPLPLEGPKERKKWPRLGLILALILQLSQGEEYWKLVQISRFKGEWTEPSYLLISIFLFPARLEGMWTEAFDMASAISQ